ncbi:MAG: CRISPR-associated helicase Cas3' [Chloroflexi bacterium]|nr:CRISPR-associated helicase Cas3' [Chloroflexota bacterium]
MPVYTRRHWGKFDQGEIHLLEHHLADVGACFEALLAQHTIRKRLARSGGLDDLDDVAVARLSILAALHDIGKANVGFQTRVWRDSDFPEGRRRPGRSGHFNELVPVLNGEDRRTAAWFFDALGWWWDATETWDDRCGKTVCALFVAALSHHGRPLKLEGGYSRNEAIWQRLGELEPKQLVERIGVLVKDWFPAAFSDGAPLPVAPEFQHMFLGLCNWADWIGSNEEWFCYLDSRQDDYFLHAQRQAEDAIQALGLDVEQQRASFQDVPDFGGLFEIPGSPEPNAIQRTAAADTFLEETLVIIESETGSGKTEAVLWRFARMYKAGLVDGLYFALPTRAAAVQIHDRVKRFAANLLPARHRPPVVLAVPGYDPGKDADSIGLPSYNPWWDDHHGAEKPWATESPKRFLSAQIAVGTVDQAMMGALMVKNAHMRAACLSRNLLVVDEVHASDTYMRVVLEALLDAHIGDGGYALLMSATLGSAARHRWLNHGRPHAGEGPTLLEAIDAPYPAVSVKSMEGDKLVGTRENDQDKRARVETAPEMGDFHAVAQRALEAARSGAKVLVIRNTVGYAIRTQQALEELAGPDNQDLLFDVEGLPALHHGRFATIDRQRLDKRVEKVLGRKDRSSGGRVVIGTQTLEQSLDIDADLLISDLCPVDVLLQRIGRLHRHRRGDRPDGYETPVCVVLAPPDNDLSPLLGSGTEANGLGPYGGVYEDLRTLEATLRLIEQHSEWHIPEMNRKLVEQATHPAALEEIVQKMELQSEDWRVHANEIAGVGIAQGQTAQFSIIRRDKSFFTDNRDVVFGDMEERIRTRLGDDRVDIVFDPQPASPFDAAASIERLAMSARWLGGEDIPESVVPERTDEGFAFTIGDRGFIYDRLGLRRV